MSIPCRHFIGNTLPAPAAIVRWCREQWPDALPQGLVFCVPTALAFRRLRDALTESYGAFQGVKFLLPAGLIDLFAPPALPAATPSEMLLLWDRVFTWLQQADTENRITGALFPGNREWLQRSRSRFAVAQRLIRLRKTLAEAQLDFGRTAAHPAAAALPEREQLRWRALDALETRYREELAAAGLTDPGDRQLTVFSDAQAQPLESGADWRLIMAAVPDFMPALTALLARAPHCDILILDTPDAAGAFTPFGLPDPAVWAARPLAIPDAAIEHCENPVGESEAIRRKLAARGEVDPADLTFALLNPEVIRPLRLMLEDHGITLFEPEPIALASRPAARLLTALCSLTPERHPGMLQPLLSAPEVAACISSDTATLRAAFNTLVEDHQPETIRAALSFVQTAAAGSAEPTPLEAFLTRTLSWIDALKRDPVAAARTFLCDLYGSRTADPIADPTAFETFNVLRDLLKEAGSIRIAGAVPSPELLLSRLSTLSLSPLRRGADCACEGRMEFLWSSAPLLFLSGLNESIFPDSTFEDPFLPDAFRAALGLRADRDRAARDAALLATACRQHRPEDLLLTCSRSSLRGDWLKPSRLLFRCDAPEKRVARAVKAFIEPPAPRRSPGAVSGIAFRDNPVSWYPAAPLTRLSPSAIKRFLTAPLDFWLTDRLRLRKTDPLPDGIPIMTQGTLLHEALAILPAVEGTDPDTLFEALFEAVKTEYARRYGRTPPVEILAARMEAERHLRSMARLESDLRAEGWQTRYTEKETCESVWTLPLCTAHGEVTLHGRIDRVDFNLRTGVWRIIDYKTGSGMQKDAEKAHWERKRDRVIWKDVQLPLYRLILRRACNLPPETPVELCYIALTAASRATLSHYTDPVSEAQTDSDIRDIAERILALGSAPLPPETGPYTNPLVTELTRKTLPPEEEAMP